MKLTPSDLKKVESFLAIAHLIEANWNLQKESHWDSFMSSLDLFQNSQDPNILKCYQLKSHFNNQMTEREFSILLIPFERLWDRNIKDEDFLVTTQDSTKEIHKNELIIVLHNLRSIFNIGSIFRSAEAFAVQKIILCGYSSTPEDIRVIKASMNAAQNVNWSHYENIETALDDLKKQNYSLYAFETSQKSKHLHQTKFNTRSAFIFGNERFGLDNQTLATCDQIISIKLFGNKNSLNVANSVNISIYEYLQQHTMTQIR